MNLLYRHAKFGRSESLHFAGGQKVSCFPILSVTLLNDKVCEDDIAIKPFALQKWFQYHWIGEGFNCVAHSIFTPLGGPPQIIEFENIVMLGICAWHGWLYIPIGVKFGMEEYTMDPLSCQICPWSGKSRYSNPQSWKCGMVDSIYQSSWNLAWKCTPRKPL